MKRRRFQLYTESDLERLPDPEWLIEGLMPARAFGVLFGPEGRGKSFVALDMALSIAGGLPWMGRRTQSGPIIYVAGEGTAGLKFRSRAWNLTHRPAEAGLALFVVEPIHLMQPESVDLFIHATAGIQPRLIVIDTLARSAVGGNENETRDMSIMVGAADHIRQEHDWYPTVLIIHHPKKQPDDPERRNDPRIIRGNTALPGAADFIYSLDWDQKDHERIVLMCDKQKDAEPFKPIWMRRETVYVGENVTSCVIEPDRRLYGERQPLAPSERRVHSRPRGRPLRYVDEADEVNGED